MNMNLSQLMQMMSSPIFKSIANAKTPQQAVQVLLKANPSLANNQMLNNALQMINSGDSKGVETMARNLITNVGGDPDQMYQMLNNINRK